MRPLGADVGLLVRKLETEADIIGLSLAARACYDPGAFVPVMTKLGEHEAKAGIRTPEFLRTHPMSDTRIKQVRYCMHAQRNLHRMACMAGASDAAADIMRGSRSCFAPEGMTYD